MEKDIDIQKEYHKIEAVRIQKELDELDPKIFKEDGIVRYVLKHRILQEEFRSRNGI